MAFVCNHLHLRSEDPDNAAKFYVDNFGAVIVSTRPLSTTVSHQLELNGPAPAYRFRRGRGRERRARLNGTAVRVGPLRV